LAGLNDIHGQMKAAWQRVELRWLETCDVWSDSVQRQFQREFWQPLETEVLATQRELAQLAELIAKARRDL
jgi:hypothetical protein